MPMTQKTQQLAQDLVYSLQDLGGFLEEVDALPCHHITLTNTVLAKTLKRIERLKLMIANSGPGIEEVNS